MKLRHLAICFVSNKYVEDHLPPVLLAYLAYFIGHGVPDLARAQSLAEAGMA